MKSKKDNLTRWVMPWIYFAALIVFVEFFVRLTKVPDYLLPAPTAVAIALTDKWRLIAENLGVTMLEALIGFGIGNIAAITMGFLFALCRPLREGFYPIIVGMQAIPIVAIAPFIQIWFGPGLLGKSLMAAVICYFPAAVISTNGFSTVNQDALFFLQSVGASRWQIFSLLRLPSAIPPIASALQVSASLCVIGAVVAELAGSSSGVGYLIVRASYEFRTVDLFAILLATSIATFIFFKVIEFFGKFYASKFTVSYAVSIE